MISDSQIQKAKNRNINKTKHSLNQKKPPTITIDAQRLDKVRDELEYATNWRRLYIDLYMHLKWLNAFAEINHVAVLK